MKHNKIIKKGLAAVVSLAFYGCGSDFNRGSNSSSGTNYPDYNSGNDYPDYGSDNNGNGSSGNNSGGNNGDNNSGDNDQNDSPPQYGGDRYVDDVWWRQTNLPANASAIIGPPDGDVTRLYFGDQIIGIFTDNLPVDGDGDDIIFYIEPTDKDVAFQTYIGERGNPNHVSAKIIIPAGGYFGSVDISRLNPDYNGLEVTVLAIDSSSDIIKLDAIKSVHSL